MHKFSKPLTGYVEDSDLKRLENLRRKVFSYQKTPLNEDDIDEARLLGRRAQKRRYLSAEINDDQRDQYHKLSSLAMISPFTQNLIENQTKIIDHDYIKTQQSQKNQLSKKISKNQSLNLNDSETQFISGVWPSSQKKPMTSSD